MIWSRKKGETLEMEVAGIRCTQCEATIKIALHQIPGVRRITIRHKKQLQVELAPGAAVKPEELVAAIQRNGYQVQGQPTP